MIELRVVSSLCKVFPNQEPTVCDAVFEGLMNETVSFQIAFRAREEENGYRPWVTPEILSDAASSIRIRQVRHVPVRMARLPGADDDFLNGGRPGLYPDPLTELKPHGLRALPGLWNALWIDFAPDGKLAAGEYPLELRLKDEDSGEILASGKVTLQVIGAELPAQTLIHTKWFHTDCLASYYGVPVFSEDYWRITENYLRCAVRHGINMILTPIHTPPLDTRPGGYRPAVQLVDVFRENGKYRFGFEKLDRWVDMCRRVGVKYYEIAHFFAQWGARFAPQILAFTENGPERIFGWDTEAQSPEYASFLAAYIPAVLGEMKRLGVDKQCWFHISDEPGRDQIEGYLAAKALVRPWLTGYPIIDALSDPAFYDSGAVEHPVPANDHIEPFLERRIPDLWTYYCLGQEKDVSNLLTAMSGARTRVFGTQLYKFDIRGILQWGFNFYYSQYSDYLIDPWTDTDCDGFTPAGDAYQVYPGRDGEPVESIRLMLVDEALQDLRAMRLLESFIGRDRVIAMIDEGIEPVRFACRPKDENWLPDLRRRINRAIRENIAR